VFGSNRDGNWEIYLMEGDESHLTRLTNDPGEDTFPVSSPGGTKIAFHSDRNGNFDIFVMNADGSGLTQLTDDPKADTFPAWSPDGQKIVFQTKRHGNKQIYVMNADGSNETFTHSVDDVNLLVAGWQVYVIHRGGGGFSL
jgi:Tol biopolymer transport system component